MALSPDHRPDRQSGSIEGGNARQRRPDPILRKTLCAIATPILIEERHHRAQPSMNEVPHPVVLGDILKPIDSRESTVSYDLVKLRHHVATALGSLGSDFVIAVVTTGFIKFVRDDQDLKYAVTTAVHELIHEQRQHKTEAFFFVASSEELIIQLGAARLRDFVTALQDGCNSFGFRINSGAPEPALTHGLDNMSIVDSSHSPEQPTAPDDLVVPALSANTETIVIPDDDDDDNVATSQPGYGLTAVPSSELDEAVKGFPHMVLPSSSDLARVQEPVRTVPSFGATLSAVKRISVDKNFTSPGLEPVNTAGSPRAGSSSNGEAALENQRRGSLARKGSIDHLSRRAWMRACDFFHFNPRVGDPRVGIRFAGWNDSRHISLLQMYGIAWALRLRLKGSPLAIYAIVMGFGKTIMAAGLILATKNIVQGLCDKNDGSVGAMPSEARDKYFRPETLIGGGGIKIDVDKEMVGVNLSIVPPHCIRQAIQEHFRFLKRDNKAVLAWNGMPAATRDGDDFKDLYELDHTVRRRDLPSGRRSWPGWPQNDKITVRQLLGSDSGFPAGPWMNDWTVFTTPHTIPSMFSAKSAATTGARASVDDSGLCVKWGLVIFDEFHLFKNLNTCVWMFLSALESTAFILGMSGTPFGKYRHMATIFMAAMSGKFDVYKPNGDRAEPGVLPHEVKWPLHGAQVELPAPGSRHRRVQDHERPILERSHPQEIYAAANVLDNYVLRTSSAKNFGLSLELKPGRDNDDVTEAQSAFIRAISPCMLLITEGYGFRVPIRGGVTLPSSALPPHTTFVLDVTLADEHGIYLLPQWRKFHDSLRDDLGDDFLNRLIRAHAPGIADRVLAQAEIQTKLFSVISQMLTFGVFPGLAKMMEEDITLKTELKGLHTEVANNIVKTPEQTVVWRYMSDRFLWAPLNSPAMGAVRQVIGKITAQPLAYDPSRKRRVAVVAFTSAIASLAYLYLSKLAKTPEGRAIGLDENIMLVHSGLDISKRAELVQEAMSDEPGKGTSVLVCAGNMVSVGLNFSRIDCMILLDPHWTRAAVDQLMGRSIRNCATQKSPYVEIFIVKPSADFCGVHEWLWTKLDTGSTIMKKMLEELESAKGRDGQAGDRGRRASAPLGVETSSGGRKDDPLMIDDE